MDRPDAPDIFDRHRRALRRARPFAEDFIGATMAEQLLERLDIVTRPFADVLLIGGRDPALRAALEGRGARLTVIEQSALLATRTGAQPGEEDALPVEPHSQDLILWPGGLDSVNDVAGALLRCRFALRPDGLLLGCFVGDGSLPRLRAALSGAEADRPAARFHPQIDLRGIGDLIGRVGLTLAVIDVELLSIAYRSVERLVADLRAAALTSLLAGPVPPLRRAVWRDAQARFAADERPERIAIVHFSGWAPHPEQPQPARRGSATASLATALKSSDQGGDLPG
jgi:hypothetical protein